MQKLLENLNPEQLAAVTLPAQPALILAGAGSGKTRVLTTRIAWLLKTGQVSTQGILAVTFTNKAAREMTARLSAMIPVNTRGMWIGTFHGLCNRLLRAHYRDAALPQSFQILDMQDQLSSVRRLLKANQVDDDKYPPRALVHYINNAKEQGLRAVNVEAYDDYDQRMLELYALYETQCQREGVVDFAELLLRSYELLSRNQLLREHYQARFKHILVDEFQDTNDLQYQWLKLMSGGGAAVFAVGDDDQSIYAFRGANVGNMAAFQVDFQVQNLIRLEQNYRSHGNILEAANALIANNSRRLGKNLHTDAGYGEPVRVFEATSDINEAQYLVEEAKSLVAEGWMRSEMAILYRSNAQSRVIEHALFGAGIPYRVYGGLRFYERAEIRHAMAYLQLMDNPHNDSAFLRVVNFPTRGIGARSIEQLQD
ncbi:MAG: UvrD-helicase domain-containing protein, partial [Oxalobacter sp.]|nr:UvrD-helicase domain-containing protein [Oxalobacter sp.]